MTRLSDRATGRLLGERVVAAVCEAVAIWDLFKSWRSWPFDLVFELRERLRRW